MDLPSFLGGVVTLVIWYKLIARFRVFRLAPAPDGFVLGPHLVSVEEEGIRHSSARHESFFRWPLVREVGVTARHIFVMLDVNAGIIIPQRDFASAAEADQLLEELRARSSAVVPHRGQSPARGSVPAL
jgi:hypothetical protein